MEKSSEEKEIILRDFLALDRTKLANQRTLLSMVRTALYFCVMGLTILSLGLLSEIVYLAYVLFALSGLFFVFGFLNYHRMDKRMKNAFKEFNR